MGYSFCDRMSAEFDVYYVLKFYTGITETGEHCFLLDCGFFMRGLLAAYTTECY